MESRRTLKKKVETLELYNEVLLTMYQTVRAFKHNFGNYIQVVDGYAKMKNLDGVQNACSRAINDYKNLNVMGILTPSVFKNDDIYNVLVSKLLEANKETICIDMEVLMDFEKIEQRINLSKYTQVLDKILTCALACAKDSEWHFINIVFSEKEDFVYTTIEFSFSKNNIHINKKRKEIEKITNNSNEVTVNFFVEDRCVCYIKANKKAGQDEMKLVN